MKRLLLSTLSYFIITMIWAMLWHLVLFHDLYVQWGAFTRVEPVMPLGIAAVIIQAVVIAYLYPFYIGDKASTVLKGVKFSLVIGLMVYTAMGFATAAKFKIEPIFDFLAYHTVFQFIQFALTGAVLGWIHKRTL